MNNPYFNTCADGTTEVLVSNGDGTGTLTITPPDGEPVVSQVDDVVVPDAIAPDPRDAVDAAKTAVAGLSANAATRKAVEALANAVEALLP